MSKVVLIGLGNMGKKYLNKFLELGIKPTLCDIDKSALQLYSDFESFCFYEDIAPSGKEKVFVAVNPESHPKIAEHFLKGGAYVFLEKPPAVDFKTFFRLVERYGTSNLGVSEIERYSYAVKDFTPPPDVERIEIKRLNRGKGYINPLWDLAWHDLYLLLYLFGDIELKNVHRLGTYHYLITGRVKNIPLSLEVAWNYPEVDRSWRIYTPKGDIVFDFLNERRVEFGRVTSKRKSKDKLLEMVEDVLKGTYDRNSVYRALRILEELEKLEQKGEI